MKWDEKPVLVTVMGEIMWCYWNLTLLAVLSKATVCPSTGLCLSGGGGTLLPCTPQWDFGQLLMKGPVLLQWWSPSLRCSFPPCSGVEVRWGGEGLRRGGGAASWIQLSVHSSFLESTRNFKNSFIIWALIEIFLKHKEGLFVPYLLLCKLNYFGFSCSQPDLRNVCFA